MCTIKNEDRLLATHISNNENFESACLLGDAEQIRTIVLAEMEKSGLHTKGANKLRDDIFRMLQGKAKVSSYLGQNVLSFVWNSRLSGTNLAVTY
jgi:hypothetical protein